MPAEALLRFRRVFQVAAPFQRIAHRQFDRFNRCGDFLLRCIIGDPGDNIRLHGQRLDPVAAPDQRVLDLKPHAVDHLLQRDFFAGAVAQNHIHYCQIVVRIGPHNDRDQPVLFAISAGADTIGGKGQRGGHQVPGHTGRLGAVRRIDRAQHQFWLAPVGAQMQQIV